MVTRCWTNGGKERYVGECGAKDAAQQKSREAQLVSGFGWSIASDSNDVQADRSSRLQVVVPLAWQGL
jgi:hypothetical protein